ncbi:acyl-CoA dehydrogenase [Intrasporangium oryzae NRRL B-24470]|uniref:Acyl-CoA dehydrogenase n=1 Tax=Intrasporangium oryzae NRRL B-24470 TaxID=1386089 RepID=W9G4D3_9MICO|nr:acyl-CoA dehydrogenase family protein [Intrasporangium oryzae]EWT00167.1 acyl-CoA dehydrogenase [Intrasporangium oryzae NRRL B-24470]
MTATTTLTHQPDSSSKRASLVERAAAIGPLLAQNAARHDAEGTFVTESYEALGEAGLLKAAVPIELGGDGATIADLAALQRELGHHCGATALASSMHQHVTAFTAWRYRRNLPGAEATLRRIAQDGIVLVSTGGGDYTHPSGTARKVDGGYVVSGRKRFASQSASGTVASTMFTYDSPDQGTRVLNVAVPLAGEGVSVVSTWNSLGMRGTASDDLLFEDVFVPDERVLANRPHGVVDGPLQVISSIAFPIVAAAYLGVAEAAYEAALAAAAGRAQSVVVQRQLGLMKHKLQVASWALDGALEAVGDDPTPDPGTVLAVMIAKSEVARAGIEVCDLAMDVVGGSGYYKGSVVERCYRDIRAAKFHPLDPETTLVETGRHALGVPGVFGG